MKKIIGRSFLVLFLGVLSNISHLVASDNSQTPTPLTGASATAYASNIGATKEAGEDDHGFNIGGASVWFVWTNTFGGGTPVLVSTEGSTFDTTMSVYLRANNNQFQLVSSDDMVGFAAAAQFNTINFGNPNVYLIAVDGYNGGSGPAMGQIQLTLRVLPQVNVTSPADGASFTEGANITVNASVNPRPGQTIENVEFYAYDLVNGGLTVIGNDESAPYSVEWSSVPVGQYYMQALAHIAGGGSNYSTSQVIINVNSASQIDVDILPTGSAWKYMHGPTDLGTNWREDDFLDGSWPEGPAPLGRQGDHFGFIQTDFANYNSQYFTTYFRRMVEVTNAAQYSELVLEIARDDALIVYINNVEVFRENLPGGEIGYDTQGFNAVGGDAETSYFQVTIPSSFLVNGQNIVAVELHQSGNNSSDLTFDLGITGRIRSGVQLAEPQNFDRFLAGTNINLSATASPSGGGSITQVQFFANNSLLNSDTVAPYSFSWTSVPAGEFQLTAIARQNNGVNHTSPPVNITIEDPQQNAAPRIVGVLPAAGLATNFSTFNLLFSEQVTRIEPSSIRINGTPATKMAFVNATNIAFSFNPPSPGPVTVELIANHNITDLALVPAALDTSVSGRTWNYTVRDGIPPVIIQATPSPGSTLGELSQLTIAFSKNVQGVNASDLLINGTAAASVTGSDATYTFNFLQPPLGNVQISWANNHGITDLSDPPNGFNGTSPNATWNYTLEAPRTLLVETNSTWSFRKGTSEASSPTDAWRLTGFVEDGTWEQAEAAFYYGENWPNGTVIPDMGGNYTTIFLRKSFNVSNAAAIENLRIYAVADDAFIAWVNGVEVARFNINENSPSYNTSVGSLNEPIPWVTHQVGDTSMFVSGENTLAVMVFNAGLNSSDLIFDMEMSASVADPSTVAPSLTTVLPVPGEVSSLTSATVRFSEAVQGVNAPDLLINGSPAVGITGSGDTYTFTFTRPAFGNVTMSFAASHGITDFDSPPKAFDHTANATWNYNLLNPNAPFIAAASPAPNSTVPSLGLIQVVFNKAVTGVNASDLLINSTPANSVSGSGTTYNFSFGLQPDGLVEITWANNHGIADSADPQNGFNAASETSSWEYTVQKERAFLVQTNTVWSLHRGTNEASTPTSAWRLQDFVEDSSWETAEAGFSYGDPWPNGTRLDDMRGNYTTIFLRKPIVINNPEALEDVRIEAYVDDGFIIWVNGVEIARYNVAVQDPLYTSLSASAVNEPLSWQTIEISDTSMFVSGENIVAVQVFNQDLTSSDLIFDMELTASIADPSTVPPNLISVLPEPGDVSNLTSATVRFSEPVQGVNAGDLLVNGVAATGISGSGDTYTFTFTRPAFGDVTLSFASSHGITDFDSPARAFDHTAPNATWSYWQLNPNSPVISTVTPGANSIVANLPQVQVTFNKNVTGVNAGDLLINGVAATNVTGSGATYTFRFPEPFPGTIQFTWAENHGIQDTASVPNAFDATRGTAVWQITLRDEVAPVIVSQVPAAGADISTLTTITVNFSEPVVGVNASDLLINGSGARRVIGSGSTYVFEFPQPSASTIAITWSASHGIADTATPANPFNANAPNASWTYTLTDNLVPVLVTVTPGIGSTVAELSQVELTFSEPVGGIEAGDLLLNGVASSSLQGSGAGPYEFNFPQPANGAVQFTWAAGHGIHDFASPSNSFAGTAFTITLQTGMPTPAVVINEIMFNPESVNTLEEYIELRNNGATPVNMTGWQLTRGVDYLFPNVTIPAGGYLVVAANTNAFRTKYPGVQNVVGGWVGSLSNSREDIELSDPYGDRVDLVDYADEGDWAVRERVSDPNGTGTQGWDWFAAADGPDGSRGGRSMELRNPALENDTGQNWSPSAAQHGTPGVVNSGFTNNIAPLILDTAHSPAVPRSTDFVTITARVIDEASNPVVNLRYRDASTGSPGNFLTGGMTDGGGGGDAVAGDGVYTILLSPQGADSVIEFYVEARDSGNRERTWPAAANTGGGTFSQAANALFQYDDTDYDGTQPIHRLIFTEAERNQLLSMNGNSNSEMNGTLVTIDGTGVNIRYNVGVRIRGAGSRGAQVNNYRVNVPTDRLWKGVNELNHNAQYGHSQVIGGALTQKAGLLTGNSRLIQVRVNGENLANFNAENAYGSYALLEVVNGDWAENHLPEDGNGNTYSARRPNTDLSYLGTNPQSYRQAGYNKTSNQSEDDWSDLIRLTEVLNNSSDETYIHELREVVNIDQWLRYFAVGTLLGYSETSLTEGTGDDYGMYRGIIDPRFKLVMHDLDTVLGMGQGGGAGLGQSIWAATDLASIRRFLRHPEVTPLFYEELMYQMQTTFAPSNFSALVDQVLAGHEPGIPGTVLDSIKAWNVNRNINVLNQIPQTLTVNHSLSTQNGYFTSTSPSINLTGSAPAVGTRAVLVNGIAATYTAWLTPNTWSAQNVGLNPGLNRIPIQAVDQNGGIVAETVLEVYYNDSTTVPFNGTISGNQTLTASGGPYIINAPLTIASGATLTIQPGTTLLIENGVNIIVANGGRLLAEGTPNAPIVFTRGLSGVTRWGGLIINGSVGSPETRITHAHFNFNGGDAITSQGGTIFLDNVSFGATDRQYLELANSSFIVANCTFPAMTGEIEGVHGTGGIKSGGVGIFRQNYFGAHTGYSDNVDFTGGNRPGPIVHFIDNVFFGTGDDLLDLDGTDAWIEKNIFVRAHQNGSPDSASAISGGLDGAARSELTIIGNIFYDLDHAVLAKEGNFYTMLNNTIVKQDLEGSSDSDGAVLILADEGTAQGAGIYLEGNIIHDIQKLVRHHTTAQVTFSNNLVELPWSGPGGGNSTDNPGLIYVPQVSETTVTNWQQAQIFWQWFSLTEGSPAQGTGPNGTDKGAINPIGVSISGEPSTITSATSATLRLGPNRTGNGIPVSGFPAGSGYTHFKWRLNGGTWSGELPINTPIVLNGLTNGTYQVEAVGKRDSGLYQDDPVFGNDAVISSSRSWIVNNQAVTVVISEILARNSSAVPVGNNFPDLLELHNPGSLAVNIGGLRLTDDLNEPNKFEFPAGTTIPAGDYLVLYADDEVTPSGFHLGFAFSSEGESIYLLAPSADGRVIDEVRFGQQLQNFSIGRLPNGTWSLTQPTFGSANRAATTGVGDRVVINEWLAASSTIPYDFIELYNPEGLPVNVGGYHLSDEPIGAPGLHRLAPLTFIPAGGFAVFIADGLPDDGPNHLNFSLAAEQGAISLADRGEVIQDIIQYGPQWLNISQGRQPNGGLALVSFDQPTPGSPNPDAVIPGGSLTLNEVFANSDSTNAFGVGGDWVELYNPSAQTINLAGYSLTDETLNSRKFVFPSGVTIPSLGYLVVYFDNSRPVSATNTGFNLSAEGSAVYLFDSPANGGGLLSSVIFGFQARDFSIGRIPNGTGDWRLTLLTPATANSSVAVGHPFALKINEWLADPPSGEDDFVEIYNTAGQPISLSGMYISDNVSTLEGRQKHRFKDLSFIGVNDYLLLIADNDPAGGPDHVGFALSAGGEAIGLSDTNGALLDSVSFGPQIEGVTEGRLPDGGVSIVAFGPTQSPGESNYLPINSIVINEVLAHSDAPFEDAIELYNTTASPVNIGGWFISDSQDNMRKFQIPAGTTVPAFGYVVFYENQFNPLPGEGNSFALSSASGDEIILSQATSGNLTGSRETVKFGPSANGISFGRYRTSVGVDFTTLSTPTFGRNNPASVTEFRQGTGATNSNPLVGPVVISQIMYRPPDATPGVDNVRDEYLQLQNITASTVQLFDPLHATNTWRLRDAVDFEFPAGVTMAPGAQILVVSIDPADGAAVSAFRSKYGISSSVPIYGPYRGSLNNGDGTIELERPDAPQLVGEDAGTVPYIVVERIRYSDSAPWPTSPDGDGDALVRISANQYGSDPANWVASAPNPGPAEQDTDGDGMPDDWELDNGFNPNNPSDAGLDSDNDGMSNLSEFIAGTNPGSASSVLELEPAPSQGGGSGIAFTFNAAANKSYSVQYRTSLSTAWQRLQNVPAGAAREVEVIDDPSASMRFYRVITPALP